MVVLLGLCQSESNVIPIGSQLNDRFSVLDELYRNLTVIRILSALNMLEVPQNASTWPPLDAQYQLALEAEISQDGVEEDTLAPIHNRKRREAIASDQLNEDAPNPGAAIRDCDEQWDAGFLNYLDTTNNSANLPVLTCCRRKLTVSFADLGWGHWVVVPKQFATSYCVGRCADFGGFDSTKIK